MGREWMAKIHISHVAHTIVFTLCTLAVSLHVMTCMWALLPLVTRPGVPNWLLAYWPDVHPDDWSIHHLYVSAFYWSIATTVSVGYGDICPSPTNMFEQLIVVFSIIMSAGQWSIVIANVVELVQNAQRHSEEFEKTMDDCERIIKLRKLEGPLAIKIRLYFRKFYDLEREKGTRSLVTRMSPMLQQEVVEVVYRDWIEDVPW